MQGYYEIKAPSIWKNNIFGNYIEAEAPCGIILKVNNFEDVRKGLIETIKSLLIDSTPDFFIFRELNGDWTSGFRVEYSFIPKLPEDVNSLFKVDGKVLTTEEHRVYTMFEVTDIKWIIN